MLDDGAPSKYGNDEVVKKCESITRAVGDDTGRNVMQGDSVKNSKPCCLSAITAEFQPLTDSSDIARAFLINWDLYNYSSNFPYFTGFPACSLVK